jgi:hypothetical protein
MVDSAFHVKIGEVELGIRNQEDPDSSQPNPIEIRWSQEMEIVIHKTVGQKPLTQCTIPVGLWLLQLKFNTLKGTDGDINETLTSIRDMDAGPRRVYDALFKDGKCMYLQKKEIIQPKGIKDYYHSVELSLIEANGGSD